MQTYLLARLSVTWDTLLNLDVGWHGSSTRSRPASKQRVHLLPRPSLRHFRPVWPWQDERGHQHEGSVGSGASVNVQSQGHCKVKQQTVTECYCSRPDRGICTVSIAAPLMSVCVYVLFCVVL